MNWKEILVKSLLALLSAAIIFFLGVWYNKYQNRIKYIDYVVTKSESILKGAKEIGDTIKFTVNGKKIENLSELDIDLINYTDSDLENLPVYIDLHPINIEGLGNITYRNIISVNYSDQNNSKELIELLPVTKSRFENGKRYGYNIKVLNRAEHSPVFSIRFLIEGDLLPEYQVSINKVGFETRKFDQMEIPPKLTTLFRDKVTTKSYFDN